MIEKFLSNLWLWLFTAAFGAVGITQLQHIQELITMAATDPIGITSIILFLVGLAGLINAIATHRRRERERREASQQADILLQGVERLAVVAATYAFHDSPDAKMQLLAATDELRRARQALERTLSR